MNMSKMKQTYLSGLLFVSILLGAQSAFAAACPTIGMSGTNVDCYGGSNGTASVAISNGSGDYTITWSNSGTSSLINGLGVGTYTVNVKDNVSGCTVVGAFVVSSPDPISLTETISNVNCFGQNTGSISINVIGGTAPYSYDWKNAGNITVETLQNLTGQGAGTYTVNITDAKLCTYSQSFTITQPIEALNSSVVTSDANCFGDPTGSIDLTVWGGTPPYSYVWTSGQSSQDVTGLIAGPYLVTVTDSKGCMISRSENINQPSALGGTISSTPVLCYGEATGSVSFSPTGGVPPYSYEWSSGTTLYSTTSNVLMDIPAGVYNLVMTDSKGCQFTASTSVAQSSQLVGSIVATNILCYGDLTGALNLTVSGGSPVYTYAWTNAGFPAGSSQDLSNIAAGDYEVTVTDVNSCQIVLAETITQPSLPVASSFTSTDVLCFGDATGSIDLTITGGTTPFTYTWGSGQSTEDISNLVAGNYIYTATDVNGCSIGGAIVIFQPLAPLAVTNTVVDILCFGESNGELDLTVTGGTMPYTYAWANSSFVMNESGQDLIGFPAETYNVVITDGNGCSILDTFTINEPPGLGINLVGTDILCKGGNNGAIDLTVTGGSIGYTYLWSNTSLSEDQTLLIAGTYGVLVTDNNNCTITDTITLTEPQDSLTYFFEVTDVKCNDGTDGEIDITVSGGTLPYNYNWSNGDTISVAQNLTSGYFTFVLTDNNGCLLTDSMFVDQPSPVTLSEVITPVTCYGLEDGVIDISPTGGTAPYNFTWYNSAFALSAQTEDLVNFPADTFQLEILDSNGCFYEMFLEIEQPEQIVIDYTFNLVSCKDGIDGNIDVTVTGGNSGPIYSWSNGATTEDVLNVPADIYTFIYTDSKGCTESVEVDVSEPDSIRIEFEITKITCNDQSDGVAFAYPDGGNGGYTYLWSIPETSNTATGLSNQWYSVTINDILGCTGTDSVFIERNNSDCVFPVNTISPNGDNYNDTWIIDNLELYPNMKMQVYNKWGNIVHEQEGVYSPWDGSSKGVQLPSETYYYILILNQENRDPITGNITIVR